MNETFLVTGCAGFIPSHIIEALLEEDFRVIGIDDLSIGHRQTMDSYIHHPRFKFIEGDVCDQQLLHKIIPEVDYIYHGAVRGVNISTTDPIKDVRVNTESTLLILNEALKKNIKQIIYPSSASVYGNPKKLPENENDNPLPLSPYGVSKLAAERYCLVYWHMYKLPVTCLRYFNNYGPRQRKDSIYGGVISIFFDQLLKGKDLTVYGSGKQTRDFVFVKDTVRATLSSVGNKKTFGEVVNIATGKETSINTLASNIIKINHGKNKIIHTTDRIIDNISNRRGDISKAQKILKFSCQKDLYAGLQETYLWFLKQNQPPKS